MKRLVALFLAFSLIVLIANSASAKLVLSRTYLTHDPKNISDNPALSKDKPLYVVYSVEGYTIKAMANSAYKTYGVTLAVSVLDEKNKTVYTNKKIKPLFVEYHSDPPKETMYETFKLPPLKIPDGGYKLILGAWDRFDIINTAVAEIPFTIKAKPKPKVSPRAGVDSRSKCISLNKQNRYQESLEFCQKWLKANPKSCEAKALIVKNIYKMGDLSFACEIAESHLKDGKCEQLTRFLKKVDSEKKHAAAKKKKAIRAQVADDGTPDFRNVRWGISKDEVIKSEGGKPAYSKGRVFSYGDKVLGMKTIVLYTMAKGKLIRAKYIFLVSHSNRNAYIDDFDTVKNALKGKYGKPFSDNTYWDSDHEKRHRDMWGWYVATGKMSKFTRWEKPRTTILLALLGDNHKIQFCIEYHSKKFMHLEDEIKKKETQNKL